MKRLRKIEERIKEYIDKSGKCWVWTKDKYNYGYGKISIGEGKQMRAHRFMYIKEFGDIPESMNVLHKCDNPSCVNPNHLYLGTQKDNVVDMMSKNRGGYKKFCGESHHNSKLTRKEVNEIKTLWNSGKLFQKDIANKFGISQQVVSKIVNNKAWLEDGEHIITNIK